jgi:protein-tyrosine phosphatase
MIDFHSHILPGADHGCDSTATAYRQLAMMHGAGTRAVVATPHFYPHREKPESFLARRREAVDRLLKKMPEGQSHPTVYLGAEVLVCAGMQEMEGLESLAIEGTDVILLEMPFTRWGEDLIETVRAIPALGLVPVMAHIDRYPPNLVSRLFARGGLLAQINAEAFSGFGFPKDLRPYLDGGAVVALGSDLHGADAKGYHPFLKMVKKLGGKAEGIFDLSAQLLAEATPIL